MAIDVYALATVNDITNFLGIQSPTDRDLLEDLINNVSASIESYCDRKFLSRSFTEYHDGLNISRIYPYQYPITTISGIWEDAGWSWDSTTLITSSNYRIDNSARFVVFNDYNPMIDEENIKIIYTAGYATIPYDIRQACIQEVVRLYKRRKSIDVSAISMADGSVNVLNDDLLPTTKRILSVYINRRLY